jgi:TatD DNase family protein
MDHFYLGFGLQITNQQSKRSREIVKNLPIKSLLIETDDHPNPQDLSIVNHIFS